MVELFKWGPVGVVAAIKVRLLTLWTNSGGFDDTTFGVTIAEPPQQV